MNRGWGIIATVAGLLVGASDADADDLEDDNSEPVPAEVAHAVQKTAPAARVLRSHRVAHNWVVGVDVGGHHEDLAFADDGTWRARSRRVTLDQMPPEVKEAVRERYPHHSLWRIELRQFPVGSVYVVHAYHGHERLEACVAEDGTILGERPLTEDEV